MYGQAHRQINKDDLANWGVKERMMVKYDVDRNDIRGLVKSRIQGQMGLDEQRQGFRPLGQGNPFVHTYGLLFVLSLMVFLFIDCLCFTHCVLCVLLFYSAKCIAFFWCHFYDSFWNLQALLPEIHGEHLPKSWTQMKILSFFDEKKG